MKYMVTCQISQHKKWEKNFSFAPSTKIKFLVDWSLNASVIDSFIYNKGVGSGMVVETRVFRENHLPFNLI